MKRYIAPAGIVVGFLVTCTLLMVAIVKPGCQDLIGPACVTFTATAVGLCAYLVTCPDKMKKLQMALAPIDDGRDID